MNTFLHWIFVALYLLVTLPPALITGDWSYIMD